MAFGRAADVPTSVRNMSRLLGINFPYYRTRCRLYSTQFAPDRVKHPKPVPSDHGGIQNSQEVNNERWTKVGVRVD